MNGWQEVRLFYVKTIRHIVDPSENKSETIKAKQQELAGSGSEQLAPCQDLIPSVVDHCMLEVTWCADWSRGKGSSFAIGAFRCHVVSRDAPM